MDVLPFPSATRRPSLRVDQKKERNGRSCELYTPPTCSTTLGCAVCGCLSLLWRLYCSILVLESIDRGCKELLYILVVQFCCGLVVSEQTTLSCSVRSISVTLHLMHYLDTHTLMHVLATQAMIFDSHSRLRLPLFALIHETQDATSEGI